MIKGLLITDAIAIVLIVIVSIAERIKPMKKLKICPYCGNRLIEIKKSSQYVCEECGIRIKNNKIDDRNSGED